MLDRPSKSSEARSGRAVRAAVVQQWLAVHVFHREVRRAVFREPGVEHARDVWMLEAREDALLVAEAPQVRGLVSPAEEL